MNDLGRVRASPPPGEPESRHRAFSGRLREGAKSYAKDADGNYLAVCQAAESVENGLRSGAVGNFISITVLSVSRCPSVGARPAVFSGQVDVLPSERRDVGQEFGRDLEPGFLPGEDGVAEL